MIPPSRPLFLAAVGSWATTLAATAAEADGARPVDHDPARAYRFQGGAPLNTVARSSGGAGRNQAERCDEKTTFFQLFTSYPPANWKGSEGMSKRVVFFAMAVAAWPLMAAAADLPQRDFPSIPMAAPVFTWAGFYFGTQTAAINLDARFRTSGNAAGTISDIAANRRPASLSADASNLASGAQVGFNAQFGSVVVGVEGDLAFPDVSPRATFFSPLNDPSAFRQDLDWFGTARGCAGIAFDQMLIYATGGVAFGDVTNSVAFLRNTDLAFQYAGRSSDWAVGYTVGGGIEVVLPPLFGRFSLLGQLIGSSSVTIKAEYLYFDLGDKNVLVNPVPGFGVNSFTTNVDTKGHIGRIGFNYRFGT